MYKTGCWFAKLPPNHVKIGVSRGTPRGMTVPNIRELNPGSWFRTAGTEEYRAKYAQILAGLDPVQTVNRIDRVTPPGMIPVLCCYERPGSGDWCHRAYISAWLCMHLGLVVEELGCEGQGYADSHPMLPAEYRRPLPVVGKGRLRPARLVG